MRKKKKKKGMMLYTTFPSPCRAFCFFCRCFTRCVKRKSHFPALAPLGAPMELCTQFSQSLFRFPGRFREKRARGSVCPATGVNVDWISHTAQERKQQKDRRKSTAADVARTKRILDPFFFPVYFLFLFLLLIIPPIVRQTAYTRTPTSCTAKDQQQKCNQALYI